MPALLTPVLQLGPFIFEGYEEPEAITFGKEQSSYKHILIGGGRVIDLMGAGDPDITWSGYFTGFQAEYRARFIDGLVKAGQSVNLATSDIIKQVVITSFSWEFHYVFPVRYTITVQVINDLTLPVTFLVPGDITSTILGALQQAQDIALLVANPSITSALALAVIAAQNASPFAAASNVAINAALSAAQAASGTVGIAITASETKLFGAG